jgi:hypothetical protein
MPNARPTVLVVEDEPLVRLFEANALYMLKRRNDVPVTPIWLTAAQAWGSRS